VHSTHLERGHAVSAPATAIVPWVPAPLVRATTPSFNSKPKVVSIRIGSINFHDPEMRPRAEIPWAKVDEYADKMERGEKFPAIHVFCEKGVRKLHLPDGYIRCFAVIKVRERMGARVPESEIDDLRVAAIVHKGTRRDAMIFASGANAKHGKGPDDDDIRKWVEFFLRDNVRTWSNCDMARQCGVSESRIRTIRKAIFVPNEDTGPRQVTVTRNGKTYPMATAKIGKTSSKKVEPQPLPADAKEALLHDADVAATASVRMKKIAARECPTLVETIDAAIALFCDIQKNAIVRDFAPPAVRVIQALHTIGPATTSDIAAAASVTPEYAATVLEQEELDGCAVREGDVWAATPTAANSKTDIT
jgi:hypothetical protein